MSKVTIAQFDLLDLLILVFILNSILVEHRLGFSVDLFWRILLCYIITVRHWLLLCFVCIASGVDILNICYLSISFIIRRVDKILLDILNILEDHLVGLIVHHVLKIVLILLGLLRIIRIWGIGHLLSLLIKIRQLLLQLLVVLAWSLTILISTVLTIHLVWRIGLYPRWVEFRFLAFSSQLIS
jgi:hypothetical protein